MKQHPLIIQGGMGAGVSGWRLARSVSLAGQLGVVSGTALDSIMVRMLQVGDPGGHYRRALGQFPFPKVADRVLGRYFIEGGKPADKPFVRLPLHTISLSQEQNENIVLACFAEVWLAKEGHDGLVGLNLLEKIQFPNVASLYGAMLAGVDYVLVGAGIPFGFPGALDALARHEPAALPAAVEHAQPGEVHMMTFDPATLGGGLPPLKRPEFLPIISSPVLASALLKRATGAISGFVVEGPTAGGHNAPPRGPMKLDEHGEPIYGARDSVDWEAMRKIGLPFWIAGSCGSPEKLKEAQSLGAAGVQLGTLFAFSEESGLEPALKQQVLDLSAAGRAHVFTDPMASPTGFPFKVVELAGTLSESDVYCDRPRGCDLGYLRRAYRKEDGTVGYRCPSEPEEEFVRKGGDREETAGRKCLCNALVANIGLPQVQPGGYRECALVTAGSGMDQLGEFLKVAKGPYKSRAVVDFVLGK